MPGEIEGFFQDLLEAFLRQRGVALPQPGEAKEAFEDALRRLLTEGSEEALAAQASFDFSLSMGRAFGVIGFMRRVGNRREMLRAKGVLKQRVLSIPYEEFKESWQTARQLVSLQGRLLLEQVFWELGGRYKSELVTGFKPIEPTGPAVQGATGDSGVPPEQIPSWVKRRGR